MPTSTISHDHQFSQARLMELLHYNPVSGAFTRRVAAGDQPAGAIAGYVGKSGYRKIKVDRRTLLAHRLAWFYMTGSWPNHECDHRDGMRDNNRWLNLRECTIYQNRQNLALRKNSKSGLTGAFRTSDGKRWRSSIRSGGVKLFLGNFATAAEAHAAYIEAKARLHTFNPTVRGVEQAGA